MLEQQAALAALTQSAVFSGEDLQTTLQLITETAARLMQAERVSLWRYTETRSAIRCVDLYELGPNRHSSGIELQAGLYPAYFRALATQEVIVASDAHADPRTCEFSSGYLTPLGISAMLDIPIHLYGRVEGVLCHEQVGPPVPWTPEDRLFGIAVANLIALAVERHERQRAEEALRESEQRLSTMLAYSPDAITLLDVDSLRFVEANEQAARLYGYDRQSLLQIGPVELSPERQPDGRLSSEAAREQVQEALAGGVPVFEWLHVNAAGERFPCEVRLVRLPHAERRLVRGSIIDIGERKRAEAALRESEARMRGILNASLDCIITIDHQGRVIEFNPASEQTFGYRREQVIGRELAELIIPPALREAHRRGLARYLATGEGPVLGRRIEVPALRADGTEFPVEISVTPILGDPQLVTATVRDITAHLRTQAELRAAKEAAEAANRAKSEFLANMSHELRTPLNSVLGYAQLLRRETGLSARQLKALTMIQQSGEHLLGLINDILDMAKIEAGTLEIQVADFDLPALLEGIAASLYSRAEAKGLVFTSARWSDIPPLVCGDERRLRQVLMNLLDNAIKYTPRGEVALKVGCQEGRVRFLVEDTGIGIRPEHLSEIFAVFHQVRDRTTVAEGTGLGLAISKRLVQLMGGELRVASTPGAGSHFWFDLELPPATTPVMPPEPRRVVGVRGAKRKVLVIEDDEDCRDLLRDLLTPLGFELQEAGDGEEGVRKAALDPPDAILMDMRMPKLDGLEATRSIRASAALRNTVIIAVSASAFEHERTRCLQAGADDFLPKPFRPERLLTLLSERLGLDLVYATGSAACPVPARPPPPEPSLPPPEQLQTLFNLARRGDIKNLLQQACGLQEQGYAPFAAQLRTLAEAYQMKRLREWLISLGALP